MERSPKKLFSALRTSVWSKTKGAGGPLLDPPLILTQLRTTGPKILLLLHFMFSCFFFLFCKIRIINILFIPPRQWGWYLL